MSNNITYEELDYYAHMASEAFMEDPMYKWTTPNEKKRKKYIYEMLRVRLYASAKSDIIYEDEEKRGILIMRKALNSYDVAAMLKVPKRYKLNLYPGSLYRNFSFYSVFDNKDYFDENTYILSPIFTAKEHWGKGVASSLIKKAIADLTAQGYKIGLDTQNPDNIPFYEKLGFKLIGKKMYEKAGLYNYYMLYEE
jgi:GNAT superfamily N-acetyltransferase